MVDYLRRTWAEIDLDAITENFALLRGRLAPGCRTMAVVKADAYGHGDGPVALALEQAGADWFAVSNINEGISLRRQGIARPILILGYTPPELAGQLASQRLAQAVVGLDYARELSQGAVAAGVEVDCHMAVDTGMSRIGFFAQKGHEAQAAQEMVAACRLPGLKAEGVFTHFAVADEGAQDSKDYTQAQYDCLCETIRLVEEAGIRFPLRHCCNSAGALCHPQWGMEMARLGIVLYGIAPSDDCQGLAPLRPAMSLRSVVTRVKEIGPGVSVSYGRRAGASNGGLGGGGIRGRLPPGLVGEGPCVDPWPPGAGTGFGVHGPDDGGCHPHPRGGPRGCGDPGRPGWAGGDHPGPAGRPGRQHPL